MVSFDSTCLIVGSEVFGKSGCSGDSNRLFLSSEIATFLADTIFDFKFLASSFLDALISLISFNRLKKLEVLLEKKLNSLDKAVLHKLKKLISKFPVKSKVFNQEKLNDSDDAGIIKITRNIKLPIKPKIFDRFIKNIFPK